MPDWAANLLAHAKCCAGGEPGRGLQGIPYWVTAPIGESESWDLDGQGCNNCWPVCEMCLEVGWPRPDHCVYWCMQKPGQVQARWALLQHPLQLPALDASCISILWNV